MSSPPPSPSAKQGMKEIAGSKEMSLSRARNEFGQKFVFSQLQNKMSLAKCRGEKKRKKEGMQASDSLRVRSFGVIWIRISDPKSVGSWYIKEADESVTKVDV